MATLTDLYVDFHDTSYDVVITVACGQVKIIEKGHPSEGKYMNSINFFKMYFENGKLLKTTHFFSSISEPIPSPFDDLEFEAKMIISKMKTC